jgi:hypothetical protein
MTLFKGQKKVAHDKNLMWFVLNKCRKS